MITESQKLQAVDKCIEMIPKHGSIRVSHVCGQTVLKFVETKDIYLPENVASYRSIAGLVIASKSNRFIKENVINEKGLIEDYDILFNPTYKYALWTLWLGIFTLIFIGLTFFRQYRENTELKLQELSSKSDSLRIELQGIQGALREVDSSIQNILTDTILVKKKHQKQVQP